MLQRPHSGDDALYSAESLAAMIEKLRDGLPKHFVSSIH
jgi:hypothetical protein